MRERTEHDIPGSASRGFVRASDLNNNQECTHNHHMTTREGESGQFYLALLVSSVEIWFVSPTNS